MNVLVYAENTGGSYKKATYEVVNYANKIASENGGEAIVFTIGEGDHSSLSKYGADRILTVSDSRLETFDTRAISKAIAAAAEQVDAGIIVFSNGSSGKALAPMVSVFLKAGLVPGAVDYPDTSNGGFTVKKSVFSGKAYAHYSVYTERKIIALNPNTFKVTETQGSGNMETFDPGMNDSDFSIKVTGRKNAEGDVPLEEAELVVSGGRGLKGPENWGIIEDLAHALNAATACSRPVADSSWRPHHEHVGQTGGTIRPNLYIAIGISGAIQHLAGVNQSKTIVVVNKDPEAPFFKAADYGIIGDAFEVVPKLTQAVNAFKSGN